MSWVLLAGTLASAAVGTVPVATVDAVAAQAQCGAGYSVEQGQAFRLADDGKPWNAHAIIPALDDRHLCVVHRLPGRDPVALTVEVVSCMNCTAESVVGVGFEDVNGDGVPDLSVAVEGVVGWDPQELSGSRYVQGRVFFVWTASADWTTLTPLPLPELKGVDTLPALWKAVRTPAAPPPPSPSGASATP